MQAATCVQLFGCFRLMVDGRIAHIPLQAQRLVAFVAVGSAPVDRQLLAERLWPFSRHARAHANLRTALWRVRQAAPAMLTVSSDAIELGSQVTVDYRQFLESDRFRTPTCERAQLIKDLRAELLPGWDEDWLTIERERARQMRMRRLEEMSRDLLTSGRTAEAIEAAFASIEIEPLRESAHLALIEAHVKDGNRAEAVHQVERVRAMLREELGIGPSSQFLDRLTQLGLTSTA